MVAQAERGSASPPESGAANLSNLISMKNRIASAIELLRRQPWPRSDRQSPPRIGIVVVNYNTAELIAGLLFTLYRVLPVGSFHRVVVIDNGSTDGSVPLLRAMNRAGLVELIESRWPQTHGPGLNRGVNRLARHADVDLVWVLDSDILVLRPDVLSVAVDYLERTGAALIGQKKKGRSYAHVSSNLIDPALVWRRGISPFWDDGEPGARMQAHLRRGGLKVEDFPFYREHYLLHIGAGTLRQVKETGETSNPYWQWASEGKTEERHYHGNACGAEIVARAGALLHHETGGLSGPGLVAACQRPERLRLSEPSSRTK